MVHNLSLVVNTKAESQEHATFYHCTIWENRFKGMLPYLKRGKALLVSGEYYISRYKYGTDGQGEG